MPHKRLGRSLAAAALPLCLLGCTDVDIMEAPQVTYASVSTADFHACGLTNDGAVYCWSGTDPRPTLVSGSIRFSSVSTFLNHTCGVALDGAAYCWGFNIVGELGTDARPNQCLIRTVLQRQVAPCSRDPLPVEGDLIFESVSVGSGHSCGLTTEGRAYCWGSNSNRQLGTAAEPECETGFGVFPCSPEPLAVEGDLRFASISAGRNHTCAVALDGSAFCWGAGGSGRLGHGSKEDSPVPVPVAGDLTFRSLSAGGGHTCGVTTDDVVYCWGSNVDLQLGEVVTELSCGRQFSECVTTPNRLPADIRFVSVTASDGPVGASGLPIGGHTCGLATDNQVYCWGLNENGQLVASKEFRTSHPVQLPSEDSFVQIDAGLVNTCGVKTDGTAVCWAFGSPWLSWVVPAG
jgi:alpha-tubulin suppressor-like RCC1 family protein